MDTFRSPLTPQAEGLSPTPPFPQDQRTPRGDFFLKAHTSDSRQATKRVYYYILGNLSFPGEIRQF